MSTSVTLKLLLVLLAPLLAVITQAQDVLLDPAEDWYQPYRLVPHDFASRAGPVAYDHMLWRVDYYLIEFSNGRKSFDHWVLCPQTGNGAPCGYIILPLTGLDGDKCAVALRADNLYLTAFANASNHWHVFPKMKHLMPTATVLPFENDYPSLIGNWTRAPDLRLSGDSFLQAVKVMAHYIQGPPSWDHGYLRRALATMVIGIPEAKRFTGIRNTILTGWDVGTKLNAAQAQYLVNWRRLSCSLLVAEKNQVWGADTDGRYLNSRGIATSQQQALDIIDVLLLPIDTNKCKYETEVA